MKKAIVFALLVVMIVSTMLFTGCSSTASVKTGIGTTVSIAKSKDAASDAEGAAQVDVIMAAVSVDGNGKIVSVDIDNAQTQVKFDAQGKITSDLSEKPKTKVELGKDYGMIKNSKIGKEWYEQIEDLEKWMTGKTIDQVKAMKVKVVDETHQNVPDEPDLTSKVTITVEDYITAVEKAINNAK